MSTRRYEKKRRRELEEATRARIVAATSALHEEVGPARTTVTEIAARAGVARPTVYKHFPDERALFGACAEHFAASNPAPDTEAWSAIPDPAVRLRTALEDTYAYYAATEQMTANVVRDAELLPALSEVLEEAEGPYLEEVAAVLTTGWDVDGPARRRLAAAIGLALDFRTWRTLVAASGLTTAEAAELMVDLAVTACVPANDATEAIQPGSPTRRLAAS